MADVMEVKLPEGLKVQSAPDVDGCIFQMPNVTMRLVGPKDKLESAQRAIAEALQSKEKEWHEWDVAALGTNTYIRSHIPQLCPWRRLRDGQPASDEDMTSAVFLFNLADVLAQGEIVVGMTEQEAISVNIHCGVQSDVASRNASIKAETALAVYRRQKESR